MPDQKIQLIIEAFDKSKDAFANLDKTIKGIESQTRTTSQGSSGWLAKMKEDWIGLSAAAYAAWRAIQTSLDLIERGAKAMQAEVAFDRTAESMGVDASKMLDAMKKASAGTIDESHLMQKAIKEMAQDIDPNKIPALFDAARVVAVKSGEDITNVADAIVDAVANNMPRGLRRFGLVSKDEFNLFNKAVASGAENLNLLDLVLAKAKIQAATMGVESDNAAIAVQRFKAELDELKETFGKGLITGLEKIVEAMKGIGIWGLLASAGYWKLMEAHAAFMAMTAKDNTTVTFKGKTFKTGPDKKDYQDMQKEYARNAQSDLDHITDIVSGKRSLAGTSLKNYKAKTKAELDEDMRSAEEELAKIKSDWRKEASRSQSRELSKQELAQFTADEDAKLVILKEHNKEKLTENETLFNQGVITEQRWLEIKKEFAAQDLENEKITLENIKKETSDAYAKMAGTFTATQGAERAVVVAEGIVAQKKIQGEIDLKNAQLQTLITQGVLDQLNLSKEVAQAKRTGELTVLEATVKAEAEINALRVQRGDMTPEEADYKEYQGQVAVLEKKRENLQFDLQAEVSDAKKVQIRAELLAIQKELSKAEIEEDKAYRARMMSQPLSAMELGFEDILKEWSKTGDQMYNLARETAQAMQQAFSDFFFDIMDGKLKSLADYVNAFLKSIARSIANIMAQEAAASIMSGGGNILSTIFGSAQGNIFDNGRLIPLAHGGIVIRPTFFPMANGMGLMGEAGPEAIMPLKRLANGNLGVQTDSAAQAVTNNLNVEIKLENKSSQQLSVSQGPTKFEFNKMIITAVIEDYQRNGMTRSILGKK